MLSNALGTTAELWEPQLPALRGFDVVRYEHRAASTVDELAQQVLELAPARFSFCGLSLGGMVGMWLAIHVPERIDRLVLACTSARFGAPEEWATKATLVRRNGMAAVAYEALDAWFTPSFEGRERFLEMQLRQLPARYAQGLEAIGAFDFRARLGQIQAPTLVVAGAEDPATTPADAAVLARHIPRSRLVVLDGAAHLANVERPDAFNAELVRHLDPQYG